MEGGRYGKRLARLSVAFEVVSLCALKHGYIDVDGGWRLNSRAKQIHFME